MSESHRQVLKCSPLASNREGFEGLVVQIKERDWEASEFPFLKSEQVYNKAIVFCDRSTSLTMMRIMPRALSGTGKRCLFPTLSKSRLKRARHISSQKRFRKGFTRWTHPSSCWSILSHSSSPLALSCHYHDFSSQVHHKYQVFISFQRLHLIQELHQQHSKWSIT